MPKPVLFVVDDDPEVLQALERDLRDAFGASYRVLGASSGHAALDTLAQLQRRHDAVALILSDQRMPQMTGVQLLERARRLSPDAKRVLLTAYADTEAAIHAINTARLDYYLLKPWDPPEERLIPPLRDLLDDWRAEAPPPFEGLRLIGHRWSPETFALKDFLARNLVPYQWLDIETDRRAQPLLDRVQSEQPPHSAPRLPVVLFADGSALEEPTELQVAERLGLTTHATNPFYDLVIVGGGPAGLAAAVYGASEGMRTVLIESGTPSGQAGASSRIENYLGFPAGLSGADLTRRAVAQARRFGVEFLSPQQAVGLRCAGAYRLVRLADGEELRAHAVLIASGVSYRALEAPGVARLTGAGVY